MYIYQHANYCYNNVMDKTIDEIRLINLDILKKEGNFLWAEIAEKIDTAPAYLSQIRSKKTCRNMGHEIARRLEKEFNKPVGWLDSIHQINAALTGAKSAAERGLALSVKTAIEGAEEENKYFEAMCDMCDQLRRDGVCPDNDEGLMNLYLLAEKISKDYRKLNHEWPKLALVEFLLRQLVKNKSEVGNDGR